MSRKRKTKTFKAASKTAVAEPFVNTKKPERITLRVALRDGTIVEVPDCLVNYIWHEKSQSFLVVHTFETARKIDEVFRTML